MPLDTLSESELKIVKATTLSVSVVDRTHVSGSGGGYTWDGKGFTTPVQIKTTHTRTTEVWVRFEDGKEDRFVFPFDLPIREQQKIAVLFYHNEIWALKNITTGTEQMFADEATLAGKAQSGVGCTAIIVAWFVLFFGYGTCKAMGWSNTVNALVGLACVVLGFIATKSFLVSKNKKFEVRKQRVMPVFENALNKLKNTN